MFFRRKNHGNGQFDKAAASALSDSALLTTFVSSFAELVRRELKRKMGVLPVQPIRKVQLDLPFSRADGREYLRIVKLWNNYCKTNKEHLFSRQCPACGSDASKFIFESYDQYPYHACGNCGTWFVPLRIDESSFEAFRAAVPEAKKISESIMLGRDTISREGDRRRFQQYFEMLTPVLRGRRGAVRYLDIGCGVGHSVELARELGWQAIGVELNETAVETAQKAGRNVVRSLGQAATSQYDIISLFETLEHITDPGTVMRDVSALLAKGGVIMMTLPQRGSFELMILREQSFHIFGGSENVGHINLFDRHGVSTLLERHGLSLMFVDSQFGSDFLKVCSHLAADKHRALDFIDDAHVELSMMEAAYQVLNNIGPALSLLERGFGRSPILITIACRASDREMLRPAFEAIQRAWREEMLRLIESV